MDKFAELIIDNLKKLRRENIMIVVLPKNISQVPWKTENQEVNKVLETKKYFENLSAKWKELAESIKKDIETWLIIMNEDVILLN